MCYNIILAPLWCDLGFFPNSRGNKAAANLRPILNMVCVSDLEYAPYASNGLVTVSVSCCWCCPSF